MIAVVQQLAVHAFQELAELVHLRLGQLAAAQPLLDPRRNQVVMNAPLTWANPQSCGKGTGEVTYLHDKQTASRRSTVPPSSARGTIGSRKMADRPSLGSYSWWNHGGRRSRDMAIETLGAALGQINRLFAGGAVTGFSDAQLLERFVSGHDAAAFEALVARHGPMVLSVCRGILRDPNDAEDAFQATFLILVKKSGTLRGHEALGPWLYRVAHRVAIRANAAAARRRACERRAGQMAAQTPTSGPSAPDEPLQALHEEIARLPEKSAGRLILCDLQRVPRTGPPSELRLERADLAAAD